MSSVTKMGDGDKTSVVTNTGTIADVDCLLWAVGRSPNVGSLHLDRVVSTLHITVMHHFGVISCLVYLLEVVNCDKVVCVCCLGCGAGERSHQGG